MSRSNYLKIKFWILRKVIGLILRRRKERVLVAYLQKLSKLIKKDNLIFNKQLYFSKIVFYFDLIF